MGQLRVGAPGVPARAGRPSSNRRLNLTTRSLRVGVVYDGRIVQERLIPSGAPVTVGSDPGCTVVVARAPRRFTLIETHAGREVLHFADGMRGKVALGGRTRTLDGLLSDGRARQGRRRCSMPLRPEHRGKVKIGDTTILFQFVRTPPMPARSRQRRRFGAWHWGVVDWVFLAVLLLSGLVHTAAVVWVESQPPATTEAIRQLRDSIFTHYVQPPPPEPPPEPAALEGDLLAAAPEPEPASAPGPAGEASDGVAGGPEGEVAEPESPEERLVRLHEEVEGEGLLALIGTTGRSSTQTKVADLLADGAVGDAQHQAIVDARIGYGRTDGPTGLRAGRAGDGIAGSADLGEADGRVTGHRVIKDSVELVGTAEPGDWEPPPEGPTGYDVRTQMRRYLGQMKRCYEKELKGDPDLAGKLVLSWTIERDGDVADVSVDQNSTGSEALQSCVASSMRRLRFASPPVELEVEGYPLLFDRQ